MRQMIGLPMLFARDGEQGELWDVFEEWQTRAVMP